MNIELVLQTMNRFQVAYLLIGGMNFMLRHKPLLTYDIDLWIEDTEANRRKCELALVDLDAEWGSTDENWGPVSKLPAGWQDAQTIYCLNSPHGAIDIMRAVKGMEDWQKSWRDSLEEATNKGTPFRGLSDADMLQCQLALSESQRNKERVRELTEILKK